MPRPPGDRFASRVLKKLYGYLPQNTAQNNNPTHPRGSPRVSSLMLRATNNPGCEEFGVATAFEKIAKVMREIAKLAVNKAFVAIVVIIDHVALEAIRV